ncbi:MAG: ribosome silencing factor [Clostridia bacterium]|nr:ribosome silencing factor [Clostridia bacterium]
MQSTELVKAIVRSLDTHKAQDIRVLEVSGVTSLADYFIIAAGTSTTQVRALTDYVDTDLVKQGVHPMRTEGYHSSQWILLDYGTVVVHVFLDATRNFYDLERLWQDARPLDYTSFLEDEES